MQAEKFDKVAVDSKEEFFFQYEKCDSIFFANNNKELEMVMILERKGSILHVI